jgi:3-oxoacyl-[acyl-carrier protein] reductase
MRTKTILITGASRENGIGAAIARAAVGLYNVAFCYNKSKERALALEAELKKSGAAIAIQADLTKSREAQELAEKTVARFGRVDVLVNCAGVAQQKLFCDITDDDWQSIIDSNLSSAFYCTRAVLPQMISAKSGKIINIASMWGQIGASMEVHYSAAKAGLIGLTKALAKEVAPSGITVNCVSPGAIMTDMLGGFDEQTLEQIKDETPLGKIGEPKDVAAAVMFLASEQTDFITGQVISVNGGLVI